MITEQSGSDF